MTNRHIKRCSLIIREMQIKTTMRNHLLHVRKTKLNKQKVWVRMWGKGNPHTLLVGTQIGADTVASSMEFPQKFLI